MLRIVFLAALLIAPVSAFAQEQPAPPMQEQLATIYANMNMQIAKQLDVANAQIATLQKQLTAANARIAELTKTPEPPK